MPTTIKNLITDSAPLKALSFIMGYIIWYFIGSAHFHSCWYTVPLSFYNIPNSIIIQAPETITILLSSTRSYLRTLDKKQLAVHINGALLKPGTHPIAISHHHLFLPDSIKLIHYTPATLTVTLS